MITIVDYGMGNLGSIGNMLKRIGVQSETTSDPSRIASAARLILPGVGAFDAGMDNLERSGLRPILDERVCDARVPVLGICLGMQLMTHSSGEGERRGLGWVEAETLRFAPADPALKVPHMGWNIARPVRADALVQALPDQARFYFVHSYYVICERAEDVLLTTRHGTEFHSGFRHGNVWGVQFHPEKSHRFGMHLLRNFAEHCSKC